METMNSTGFYEFHFIFTRGTQLSFTGSGIFQEGNGFHWSLCHCGSRVLTKTGEPMISPSESCLNEYIVPSTLNNHLDSEITSEYVMHVTDVSSSHQVNIDLFEKALEGSLETDYFIPSFDGAMKYLSRNGYFVRNVKQLESPGKIIFTLNISKKFFQKQLFIPWGKGVLKTNQNYYCRYFSWRIWAIPLRWRGMPKMALKEENPILARKLASILFWMDPNIKVLRYFFKSIFYRSRKFLGSV